MFDNKFYICSLKIVQYRQEGTAKYIWTSKGFLMFYVVIIINLYLLLGGENVVKGSNAGLVEFVGERKRLIGRGDFQAQHSLVNGSRSQQPSPIPSPGNF